MLSPRALGILRVGEYFMNGIMFMMFINSLNSEIMETMR